MSNKYANDYISATLWDRGYGRGYAYEDVRLNGGEVPSTHMWRGGIKELRKLAKVGDRVQLAVYSARGYWRHEYLDFVIKGPDEDDIVSYHQSFKDNRKRYASPQ